jgi:hypothetical protein
VAVAVGQLGGLNERGHRNVQPCNEGRAGEAGRNTTAGNEVILSSEMDVKDLFWARQGMSHPRSGIWGWNVVLENGYELQGGVGKSLPG